MLPVSKNKRKLLILIVSPTFPYYITFAHQNEKKKKIAQKSLMQSSQKVIPIFPTATYRIGEKFAHNITFSTTNRHTSTSNTNLFFYSN